MAFFQGVVTTFSGATGLLQTMLGHVLGAQHSDSLGIGDGVLKTFSKTLLNTPLSRGQCRVQLKISSEIYDLWDNGEEIFEHEIIDTSSLNYATGDISITTNEPVDSGWSIPVDYVLGDDGEDWFLHLDQTTKDNNNNEAYPGENLKEVVIKNSGISWKDKIITGLREWQFLEETLYGLNYNMYKQYNYFEESQNNWNINSASTGKSNYDNTRNNWIKHPNMPLNNDNMYYWIFSNKRRIIIIVRVAASIYVSGYLGGCKALASPSNFPKPYCVIAPTHGNVSFASTSNNFRFIIHLNSSQIYYSAMAFDEDSNFLYNKNLTLLPKYNFMDVGELKKTKENKLVLYPVYFYDYLAIPKKSYSVLDGVFFVPGINLASEDIIEIGGDDYLIIQNIFRTSYQDYMAIKME